MCSQYKVKACNQGIHWRRFIATGWKLMEGVLYAGIPTRKRWAEHQRVSQDNDSVCTLHTVRTIQKHTLQDLNVCISSVTNQPAL